MRVGFLSHAMLALRAGGMLIQVTATLAALKARGVNCRLFDPYADDFTNFDLVHVFSALHATHLIVRAARSAGVPVVISPVLLIPGWNRWRAYVASVLDRLVGRLTDWEVQTTYGQVRSCLNCVDLVLALGQGEKKMLMECYGVDPRVIRVVPNAIAQSFFDATPEYFRERYGLNQRFVLCAGLIDSYKNQLMLIEALQDEDVDIVLVGLCDGSNQSYLDQCLAVGGDRVHYLGLIDHDDPVLASAFAAAAALVLPSRGEVAPTAALEAWAAGKPVILTKYHSLDITPDNSAFIEVDPRDPMQIRDAVRRVLANPPDSRVCKALVKDYTWEKVSSQIVDIYAECLGRKPPVTSSGKT